MPEFAAKEGQHVAVAKRSTQLDEVVSHPLATHSAFTQTRDHLKELVSSAAQGGEGLLGDLAQQLLGIHLQPGLVPWSLL